MPRESKDRGPIAAPRDGPIQPGSPLYRLLQMVARAIAQDYQEDGPAARPDAAPEKE